MRADYASGLAQDFVALNDYLRAGERDSAMQRLVALAVETVPGCDWAAITVWRGNGPPASLACSADVAQQVDDLQYELGTGPCLDAAQGSEPVRIADTETDERWPKLWASVDSGTPVRSVLAIPLDESNAHRSALNLYGAAPGAFTDDAFNVGVLFASHARALMVHALSAEEAATLTEALSTSRQIGAAIGILMNVHKITEDRAFDLLRATSQHLHRKLRDIAAEVTQTGTLPSSGRPRTGC
jgi:GAF domain-containing protein